MEYKTSYPFCVEPQEVDFSLRITWTALSERILNTAGVDAHSKGFGVDAINKENYSWVLSRIAFEFDRRPLEYEKYTITTWISDYGRLMSTRNFTLTDASGAVFGRVVSQWCMIDLSTRMPADLRKIASSHDEAVVPDPSPAEKPRKVLPVETERSVDHPVVYSDIDFNRHVNTIRYIEMMLDLLPLEFFGTERALRLDVNFLHESVYGDLLRIGCARSDDGVSFEIRNQAGTPICRAALAWHPDK